LQQTRVQMGVCSAKVKAYPGKACMAKALMCKHKLTQCACSPNCSQRAMHIK